MAMLYRHMHRAALDRAYNNSQAVPDFSAIMANFRERSAEFYRTAPCQRDIPYGIQPRQCFDWFPSSQQSAPTFVFIHGGYWQSCAKEDFAFIAQGPLAHGFNVALAEYTLAPEVSMTQIVEEIGCLLDQLATGANGLGTGKQTLCLSGHSAGGHLTALQRNHPAVVHAMPISALVDLKPISLSQINDKLHLTPREVDIYSPLHHINKGAPMTVTVGAEELPELVRHSYEYAQACQRQKEKVQYIPVPNCNHFSILEDLASSTGIQMVALVQSLNE